jgi:hypothetical protein
MFIVDIGDAIAAIIFNWALSLFRLVLSEAKGLVLGI